MKPVAVVSAAILFVSIAAGAPVAARQARAQGCGAVWLPGPGMTRLPFTSIDRTTVVVP